VSSRARLVIRVVWPILFVSLIALAVVVSSGLIRGLPTVAGLIPLGLFGLYRWVMWLARKIPAAFYQPYGGDFRTSASIVVPVYREEPDLLRTAIESWLANKPDEIILVIDETDDACIAVARAYPTIQTIVTDIPGKRPALVQGISRATSEIVVLVDSDTVWDPEVLTRIMRPFADPKIGGVGTRQNVYQPQSVWQRLADTYLDIRYSDEATAYTVVGRAVSCLSGRTAAYRRAPLEPLLAGFLEERFLGRLCMSGEDKRLTSLIRDAGYETYHQGDAQVWSGFPSGFRATYAQRLRWARNSFRSDLSAFHSGEILRHPYLALMLADRMISPFALLIAFSYGVMAIPTGQYLVALLYLVWWIVSRFVKMLPHLVRVPRDIVILPAFIVMNFGMAFLKLHALLTVHQHKWGTRPVEVVDGQVVRVDPTRHAIDHVPLRARLAGSGLAASLFLTVQLLLIGFGGAGYLPRPDTTPPTLRAEVPGAVEPGDGSELMVAVEGEDADGPITYLWTIDGQVVGSTAEVELPSDLEPGSYRWAVHVRDGFGNTASRDGTFLVTDSTQASEPGSEP
jgi:hyaluronan synthase